MVVLPRCTVADLTATGSLPEFMLRCNRGDGMFEETRLKRRKCDECPRKTFAKSSADSAA
jgi:hypothetical protein